MLNIYCWRCGNQIDQKDVLGIGHFDQEIGKYQGKGFIAFKCSHCQKVRYQILENNIFTAQKKILKNNKKEKNINHPDKYTSYDQKQIDIDQVIDFYEELSEINTVDSLLQKCSSLNSVSPELNRPITQPLDIYNLFQELNPFGLKRIMIVILNESNQLLSWEFLGEGTDNPISFEPKKIFQLPFMLEDETGVIIAENLKEKLKKPSQKEVLLTRRLIKAGKILGIQLIDRIIIAEKEYYSFDELDLMQN